MYIWWSSFFWNYLFLITSKKCSKSMIKVKLWKILEWVVRKWTIFTCWNCKAHQLLRIFCGYMTGSYSRKRRSLYNEIAICSLNNWNFSAAIWHLCMWVYRKSTIFNLESLIRSLSSWNIYVVIQVWCA